MVLSKGYSQFVIKKNIYICHQFRAMTALGHNVLLLLFFLYYWRVRKRMKWWRKRKGRQQGFSRDCMWSTTVKNICWLHRKNFVNPWLRRYLCISMTEILVSKSIKIFKRLFKERAYIKSIRAVSFQCMTKSTTKKKKKSKKKKKKSIRVPHTVFKSFALVCFKIEWKHFSIWISDINYFKRLPKHSFIGRKSTQLLG